MARFDIISKSNPDIKRYSGKPRYVGTYLKPSFLEFAEIASPSPIAWEVGDYVDYPRTGMRYYLYSIPQASKKARRDTNGGAFVYSGVQFHAATKELEIALFRDIVSNDNNIHFSTSPDVNTFEDVYGIALRIQECMNDLYPDRWEIRVADFDDADIIEKVTTKKDFALSGGTCLDALSKIYELWQDIGWIHTYDKDSGKEVITIGYANALRGDNVSEKFLFGKGNGLTAIKKNQTNKKEFATRLYVYGSDRNLPPRYYSQMDFPNAESADIRNLMLPIDVWGLTNGSPDPRKAYLQNDEAVAKYGVIPKTHYFDSDDAGADIHPTIERLTIGEVRGIIGSGGSYYPSDRYSDSERADAVLDAVNPNDDGVTNKDGRQYEAYTREDLSWISPNSTIPDGSKEDITFKEVLFEVNFDLSGMGEISINPDMNFLIQGSEIEKVSASFEMSDDLTKQKELSITKDIEGKQLSDYTWSIAIPRMAIKYNQREYDSFPAYLTMKITVTPKSSSERTVSIIPPTTPLRVNFARLLPTTFTMRLRQIGFNIEERAAQGKGKTISMKSGMCEGRGFIISSCKYDEANDSWDLVCKRQKDESLGILFPNIDYPIQPEDEFVLLDIAMPDLYVKVAMQRLLREGERLLARASKEMHNYEPSIDAKVMIESGRVLREGMFMEISDEDVVDNTTEYILIDTLNIREDESAIPTYNVTLRERRKVTYKGTPSATTTSNTTSAEDGSEDSGDLANKLAALEFLKDMFYWHDEARTIIGTKHALFSEKTVASGGKAADSSGSGSGSTGGGFVVLEDWLKYDATLPQVLGAVLGVELHNRLTAIENGSVTPDLTPYATVAFVEQTINNLIGGAGDAYDTLIEIQRILQGNEGDINTLLTEIATKASKEELASLDEKYAALIEALIEKNSEQDTTLEDHETRLETLEDKEAMFRWVTDADGTRRIETDYDLASLRTIASGGQAQNGEGGAAGTGTVMAVEVNGEIHDAEDGIVTLPDYPTKDEYDGKMSSLDAKDKAFAENIAENAQEIEFLKPRVEKNEGDIKDLQVVDEDIQEQLTKIREITDRFSYDAEQDMLLTPSNIASQKTIASGGAGTEGDGEGGGGTSGTLDGLLDVEIDFSEEAPTEEDRPMLAYDTTDFIWKNRKTMHRHPQGVASSVWTITHNLNKVPNVKVIDSTGQQVYGMVQIGDNDGNDPMNIVRISFGGAFSGTAYLD